MKNFAKSTLPIAALTAAVMALSAATAHAAPIVITPTVEVAATTGAAESPYNLSGAPNFADSQHAGQYWGNEVSGTAERYATNQIIINRVDDTHITFTMRTAFDGQQTIGSNNVRYADLFFSSRDTNTLDTPNTGWAFGIALGGDIAGGGTGQQLNGGVSAGLYAIDNTSDFLTSNQIWSTRSGVAYGGYAAQIADVNAVGANATPENSGHDIGDTCTTAGGGCAGTWNNTLVGHAVNDTCSVTATDCAGTWNNTASGHTSGQVCANTADSHCINKKYNDLLVGHTTGTTCDVTSSNCTSLKWTTDVAGHTTPIAEIEPATHLTADATKLSQAAVSVDRTAAGTLLWNSDSILHSANTTCTTAGTDCVGTWNNTLVGHAVNDTCSVTATDCAGTWNNTASGHTSGQTCSNTGDSHCTNKKYTDLVVGHTSGTTCAITATNCTNLKWTSTVYNHHAGDACTTAGTSCVAMEWDGADGIHLAGDSCYIAGTHCLSFYDLTVTVSADQTFLNELFDHFDILWGTGDCANDTMWGAVNVATVPTPSGLALFGFGIVGLLGLAHRRRRLMLGNATLENTALAAA